MTDSETKLILDEPELTPETIPLYSGYQNKPTWLVALWIDNCQGSHEFMNEQMTSIIRENPKDSWITKARDVIKAFIEDPIEELENASLLSDIIGWALAHVEYEDLARKYIEQAQEDILSKYK